MAYCAPNTNEGGGINLPPIDISHLFNSYQLAKYNRVVDFAIGEIFRKYVADKGWTVSDLADPDNVTSVYRGVKTYLTNMLIDKANNPSSLWSALSDEAVADLDKIIDNFDMFAQNHAVYNNIANIKEFTIGDDSPETDELDSAVEGEDEDDASEDEEAQGKEETYNNKVGNEQSQLELASKNVKVLFRLIPKADFDPLTEKVKIVQDRNGLPAVANFMATWNLLAEKTAGLKDYNDFMNALTAIENMRVVPELQFINEMLRTEKQDKSPSEVRQFMEFYQSFSKPKVPIKSSFRSAEGIHSLNDEILGNRQKIETAFNNNFVSGDIPEDFKQFTKTSPTGVNYLRKNENDTKYIPPKPTDTDSAVKFLQFLGVQFTGVHFLNPIEYVDFGVMVEDVAGKLWSSLEKRLDDGATITEPLKQLRKKYNNIFSENTSVKRIIDFESRFSRLVPSHSSRTAEGELQQLISNDSALSVATYYLNNSKTLDELMKTPSFINAKYNPHFKDSYIINFLYDKEGNRIANHNIRLELLSGDKAQQQGGKTYGKVERKLSDRMKLIQDYNNFFVGGKTDVMRTETSNSFYMIGLYDRANRLTGDEGTAVNKHFNPRGFTSSFMESKEFKIRVFNWLSGEVTRIKSYDTKKAQNPTLTSAYGDFSIFSEIFENGQNQELKDRLLTENFDYDSPLFGDFLNEYEKILDKELKNFKDTLAKLSITPSDLLSKNFKDFGVKTVDGLHRAFIAGTLLQNIEFSILYTGDSLFYKDMHKRLKGLASTGSIAANIPLLQQYFNSDFEKNFRSKYSLHEAMGVGFRDNTNNFKTQTMKEYPIRPGFAYLDKSLSKPSPKMVEAIQKSVIARDGDLGNYTTEYVTNMLKDAPSQKPADGEGYMNLDFHRELSFRFGFNTPEMENSYKYEGLVFKKDILGKELTQAEKEEMADLEEKILSDPDKHAIPIIKATYWGNIENSTVDAKAFDKFSIAPILPTLARNHNDLKEMMLDMVKGQYAYVKYESGTKSFATTPATSLKGATPDLYSTPLLKEQIKTHNEVSTDTSIPTQMVKLLLSNLFDKGVPKTERVKAIYDRYLSTLKDIQKEQVNNVLEDLGFSFKRNNGDWNITNFNINKLSDRLIREAKRQQLNSNVVSSLEVNPSTKTFNISPEASGFQKQINDLVAGILDRSLRRFRFAGGDFVLMSNANMSPLPFYEYGDEGTTALGCRITMTKEYAKLLNKLHPDGEKIGTLERINKLLKNPEWRKQYEKELTVILDRVPTQGQNSMDVAQIHEFLFPTAGNVVIMPDEIVFKSGTDFDYDKEKVITPFFDSNGNYLTNAEERKKEVLQKLNELQDIYPELKKMANLEEIGDADETDFLINKIFQTSNKKELIKSDREVKQLLDEYAMLKGNIEAIKNNSILEIYKDALLMPESFAELVAPNSNTRVKDVATKNGENIDQNLTLPKLGRTYYYSENLKVYKTFFDAKTLLAPFAVDNTFQQLLTYGGIDTNATYRVRKYNRMLRTWEYVPIKQNNLLLSEEERSKIEKNGKILTSLREDVDGIIKQHWNSESINATVDAAKDPFFALMRVLWGNIGVVNYLKNQGVPFKRIIDFINHPTLQYYFALRENGMKKNKAIEKVAKDRLSLSFTKSETRSVLLPDYNKFITLSDDKLREQKLLGPDERVATDNKGFKRLGKNEAGALEVTIEKTEYPTYFAIKQLLEDVDNRKPISFEPLAKVDKWINFNPITAERLEYLARPENDRQIVKSDPERKGENLALYSDEIRLFAHFFALEEANYAFRDFQKYFNFDTTKASTLTDIRMKERLFEKMGAQNMFSAEDLQKMVHHSILSGFMNNEILKQVYERLFPIIGRRNIQDRLTDIYKEYDDNFSIKNKRDLRNLPKLLANDFLTSVVFNYGKVGNRNIFDKGKSLLIRSVIGHNTLADGTKTPVYNDTIADRLAKFKKQSYYGEIAKEFPVLDRLITNKQRIDSAYDLNGMPISFMIENIQLIKSNNETLLEQEEVIEQFRNLYSNYKYTGSSASENEGINKDIKSFMEDLFVVGIIQSGFNRTFIGFSEYIPNDFTSGIYKDAINKFTKLNDEQIDWYMDNFHDKFRINNPRYFPSWKDRDEMGKRVTITNTNKYSDRFKYYQFPHPEPLEGKQEAPKTTPALPPSTTPTVEEPIATDDAEDTGVDTSQEGPTAKARPTTIQGELEAAGNRYMRDWLAENPAYYVPIPKAEWSKDNLDSYYRQKGTRITMSNLKDAIEQDKVLGDQISDSADPEIGTLIELIDPMKDSLELPVNDGFSTEFTGFANILTEYNNETDPEVKEALGRMMEEYGLGRYAKLLPDEMNPNQLSLFPDEDNTTTLSNGDNINLEC